MSVYVCMYVYTHIYSMYTYVPGRAPDLLCAVRNVASRTPGAAKVRYL